MKRALIVSPYLNNLGGGERYMLSLASSLVKLGYDLTIAWNDPASIQRLVTLLGISLETYALDPHILTLYHQKNPLKMFLSTRKYDLTVYLSDGSLPLLGSKKNIIHMQVPFHNVGGRSLVSRIKKRFCHQIIVNSNFTKRVIDKEYGVSSVVLYPPVPKIEKHDKTKKVILSVGRFEPSLNVKKQDVLIDAFRLYSQKVKGWKLVLVGGSSAPEWIEKLKDLSIGLDVEFKVNATNDEIRNIYEEASIYWHGAGYGVDEEKSPEITEHFGISTVEALMAGCAPFVVGKGGQKEIIKDDHFLWTTKEELVEKTIAYQTNNYELPGMSSDFSEQSFLNNLSNILKK